MKQPARMLFLSGLLGLWLLPNTTCTETQLADTAAEGRYEMLLTRPDGMRFQVAANTGGAVDEPCCCVYGTDQRVLSGVETKTFSLSFCWYGLKLQPNTAYQIAPGVRPKVNQAEGVLSAEVFYLEGYPNIGQPTLTPDHPDFPGKMIIFEPDSGQLDVVMFELDDYFIFKATFDELVFRNVDDPSQMVKLEEGLIDVSIPGSSM